MERWSGELTETDVPVVSSELAEAPTSLVEGRGKGGVA